MKSKVLLFACCAAFVTAMFLSGCSKKSTITYVTSKAQKQDIKTTITATGSSSRYSGFWYYCQDIR